MPEFSNPIQLVENHAQGSVPQLAVFPDGRMAVVWDGDALFTVYAQIFSKSGDALTDAILVSEGGFRPTATVLEDGSLAVVYLSARAGTPRQLKAEIFDGGGNATSSTTLFADTDNSVFLSAPSTISTDIGFTTVFALDGPDGSGNGVFAANYNFDGEPVG